MSENNCKILDEIAFEDCPSFAEYKEYENKLFEIYHEIYESGNISFQDCKVAMKHYPPDFGERTGFYHMICENYDHTNDENDRKPSLRRCERIRWAKAFIEWCADNCAKVWLWENERHGKKNVLIYCPEQNYLVVLAKRNGYYLLTTAYVVEYEHARNKLEKEYNSYKTNNASHKM